MLGRNAISSDLNYFSSLRKESGIRRERGREERGREGREKDRRPGKGREMKGKRERKGKGTQKQNSGGDTHQWL